eukprot:s1410_g13.t1
MALKTVIVGGGIGGCAAAIALHRAGADVTIYEAAPTLKEIGAGINIQAVAMGVLTDLGIPLESFHEPGQGDAIFTSAVEYFTPEGFFIASEAVGLKVGSAHPQLSAHRAKFHNTLVAECCRLLGEDKVILNSRFVQLERHEDHVVLHFENSTTKEPMAPVTCHFVVGADGLKSRLRGALLGDGDPRRQVQLAEVSRYTALRQRSLPNQTMDTSDIGQERVRVVTELPSGTPTAPTILATTSTATEITEGTTEGTEGTTVPRMSLPLVPLRLGQTRKELKFIHITKTGGTAIEDWAKAHGLLTCTPNGPYAGYDWFMVVRDPVERIVSEYYCPWTGTKTPETDTEDAFNKFVQRSLDGSRFLHPGSFQAMSEACQHCPELEGACSVHDHLDRSSVQHVLHFESLALDLARLLPSYGISFNGLPRKNAVGQKFNSSNLWPKTLKMIRAKYAADFENFNYTCHRYTGRMIYRGLCEVDDIHADGCTVSLCGDATGNFICYPISERLRQENRFLCNWGLCVLREHPGGEENWTSEAGLEEIRQELQNFGGNSFAGLTPLQMAERTEKIIGWSLFDRDPLKSFDFGNVTLLGDAAHPLLPYGSQGATQAIMDAEALGVSYQNAMAKGTGVRSDGQVATVQLEAGGLAGCHVAPVAGCGLAGAVVGSGKSLSVLDRDVMRRDLEKKYTGTVLTLSTLPSMSLLHAVYVQQQRKAWDWIPWKKIMSEKAASVVKGRRSVDAKDSFMEALAFGAGFYEEHWDKELSGAPFQVQNLLQIRAHAYSMVGACHLGSWALYINKFMEYYTKEAGEHFRFPNVSEAEEADQLALREIFSLCFSGASFDDAISTVDYAVAPSEAGSAPSVIEVDSYALKPKLVCSIVDGGGNGSSAVWLQPRVNLDILKPLRHRFCQLAGEHHVVQRPLQHVKLPADRPFFAAEEVLAWRFEVQSFLSQRNLACHTRIREHQPFVLDVWRALSLAMQDPDSVLPALLVEGVPTGIQSHIAPSGIWDEVAVADTEDVDLDIHLSPWPSGLADVELTKALIMKDVNAGHAFILQGGADEARQRWGTHVAAGRLGVVQASGRKPRLIGDGSISGANRACKIPERTRLPGLHGVQRFLSLPEAAGEAWMAFSFDVAGAHKQILIREADQGLTCFVLEDCWYVYRSCYFGAKFSAYWWARTGAWLTRMLHKFIYLRHGFWLYVDDGLLLVPKRIAPLIAATCIMFLCALGVPLSWRKLAFGSELVWIGWKFCFSSGTILLPEDKAAKIQDLLQWLLLYKGKVQRSSVEKLVGMLIWFTAGAPWLRPWLSAFYKLLQKPAAVTKLLLLEHFELLVAALDSQLTVGRDLPAADICKNWRLHSVANATVDSLRSPAIVAPRVQKGRVSCVLFNYDCSWTKVTKEAVHAAKFFSAVVQRHAPIPLRLLRLDACCLGAADAYATSRAAGIGGWWLPAGAAMGPESVLWFSMQLRAEDLPKWCAAPSLQTIIASLEALAQLVLLELRAREADFVAGTCLVQLGQLCDNEGTTAACIKWLTQKEPLCYILQVLGFVCAKRGVCLELTHVAGVRNVWADELSRGNIPAGFAACNRRHVDLLSLLQEPWCSSASST